MAKLRLNKEIRESLVNFAKDNVRSTTYDAQAEKAYLKALPLVLAAVAKKYPADDMGVLAKYGLARADACLIGYGETGQQLRFSCKDADAPVVPSGYCSSRNYAWTAKCATAIEDYNFKKEQAREDCLRVLHDYTSLIANYQTAEDILEVWPAAQVVIQGYLDASSRNLPATLSAESVERIKSLNVGAELVAA